jgi:hypothetical protein
MRDRGSMRPAPWSRDNGSRLGRGKAMRLGILVCVSLAAALATFAAPAAEVRTINPSTFYPEGPLWFNGKLYYVEYANHTVMTWNGQENRRIWR